MCTIGDGAFQMLGMNELLTVKRHWREWENPCFIVLVLHNGDLTQVSWEMREVGDPRYDTSQLVEDMDYAGYAGLLGLRGITVKRPEEVEDFWEQAFAADRPVVLDVHTDPNVPPLPAHISFDEAKGFLSTLLKGDPAESAVIRNSARAMAAQLFAKAKDAVTHDDTTQP
ncbi:MAG: thiamine pyrophosphate-dependent enzyme [Intrasporangium sp.]|uniref:thiamine pyrophosphate-dependent enzyme n=1 Tax=Intrasporangium sp. TaxID=1925024 RepID=UPI002648CD68|nr:thiamine pyrophosphate-dependent enzyme [Intrasporangium sp.]MDN5795078.1 thiamine pyrophosphate-dependent enzyme [Intrasporangium sp.]